MPAGAEGFTTEDDREMLSRIEKQLRRRFPVGSQVMENSIVQDFVKQVSQGVRLLRSGIPSFIQHQSHTVTACKKVMYRH